MNAPFMNFFHQAFADARYPSLKFNFFYSEAKRKVPDPQPLLLKCYEEAIEKMPVEKVVIGGKSMGMQLGKHIVAQSGEHPAGVTLSALRAVAGASAFPSLGEISTEVPGLRV